MQIVIPTTFPQVLLSKPSSIDSSQNSGNLPPLRRNLLSSLHVNKYHFKPSHEDRTEFMDKTLTVLGQDLLATKYYHTAVTAILFYDVSLTLDDEVAFIWSAKKTYSMYLYMINRYFACASAIIVNFAYFFPPFGFGTCDRWSRYQVIQNVVSATISEILMMLRVYAMSGRNKYLQYIFSAFISIQAVFGIVIMSLPGYRGTPVPSTWVDAFNICNLYPDRPMLDAAYLLMSLVFNSLVFAATLFYTFRALKSSNPKHLVQTVRRDGIFYFFVVFTSHLTLFMCIQYGRPAIKALPAAPNPLLISVMISRLTLSLYKANEKDFGGYTTSAEDGYRMTTLSTFEIL